MAVPLVSGQALEPRIYSNIPTGFNFLILGYSFSQGDVLVDPSLPLKDLNAQIHLPILAYFRSMKVLGRSGKIDVVIPFAWLSGSARTKGDDQVLRRRITGFGDPSFRFTINLLGAPALPLKEFIRFKQKSIIGVSFQVIPPFGQYDPAKLGNIGANRWTFKPEIGFSQAMGMLIFEASTALNFYTTNQDFWGGKTRKQSLIFSTQGHAIYTFPSGIWASLGITFYSGGKTTVNGVVQDDLQSNWRTGAKLSLPINRRNSLKLFASTGLYTRTGSNFSLFGIAWQLRWGRDF